MEKSLEDDLKRGNSSSKRIVSYYRDLSAGTIGSADSGDTDSSEYLEPSKTLSNFEAALVSSNLLQMLEIWRLVVIQEIHFNGLARGCDFLAVNFKKKFLSKAHLENFLFACYDIEKLMLNILKALPSVDVAQNLSLGFGSQSGLKSVTSRRTMRKSRVSSMDAPDDLLNEDLLAEVSNKEEKALNALELQLLENAVKQRYVKKWVDSLLYQQEYSYEVREEELNGEIDAIREKLTIENNCRQQQQFLESMISELYEELDLRMKLYDEKTEELELEIQKTRDANEELVSKMKAFQDVYKTRSDFVRNYKEEKASIKIQIWWRKILVAREEELARQAEEAAALAAAAKKGKKKK